MNSVKKFEFEIDTIFEKVYTVNESVSSLEREALIKGFEDGLNEGFGSWFGSALGKTTNFFRGIPDKLKSWYDTGKEYAVKAWDWIKNLANDIATKVKDGFNTAVNWCKTNFSKFIDWVSNTFSKASEAIKSAWQKFKDKISDFSDWCLDVWTRLTENVKSLVRSTVEKLKSLGTRISEWISNSWQKIKEFAEKAKNSVIEGFRKLGEMVLAALKTGLRKTGEIASAVLLVCAWPFSKLIELVKKVPSLFQKLVNLVSDYIKSEIVDFKRAYAEEMERYRLSKLNDEPPVPPTTSGPNVDLNLPEEEMSDEEAANRLAEIKRKLAERRALRNEGYNFKNIKNFRSF